MNKRAARSLIYLAGSLPLAIALGLGVVETGGLGRAIPTRVAGVPRDVPGAAGRVARRSPASPARAEASTFHHRSGVVDAGATIDFSLPLSNDSRRPLGILGQGVTCGCLSIRRVPRSIAPGGRARVDFQLATDGRPPGNMIQAASLETDDPEQPVIRFTVGAGIRGAWAEPSRIDFGPGYPGQEAPRSLKLCALGLDGLEFVAVEADDRSFEVEFDGAAFTLDSSDGSDVREPIRCRNVRVRIAPDASTGSHEGLLTIRAQGPSARTFAVPLSAEVIGAVRCLPPTLLFVNVPRGRSRTALLRLIVPEGRQTDLSRLVVSTDLGELSARVHSTSSGRGEVAVTFRSTTPAPGPLRGRIVGTLDGTTLFEVPVLVNAGTGAGE